MEWNDLRPGISNWLRATHGVVGWRALTPGQDSEPIPSFWPWHGAMDSGGFDTQTTPKVRGDRDPYERTVLGAVHHAGERR